MLNFLLRKFYASKIPKGHGKKVAVGLSGGVDSSVAAALLKERGYDVTAVFIKVWQPDFMTCTWKEDRRDAMRVSAVLSIPFKTINLEETYKTKVVDYMVKEYETGHTPNPDVMCNTFVKFGAFYEWAKKNDFLYVATGHYARSEKNTKSPYKESHVLMKGFDTSKDQSYFLWQIEQEKLEHIIFPVGIIPKKFVRRIAKSYALPTATKKDSQGLCFLGHVNIGDFLARFITLNKGHVKDLEGNSIGQHNGAALYTIGQRHGFTVSTHSDNNPALYIVEKDLANNTLTVATTPVASKIDFKRVPLREVCMRGTHKGPFQAQIRYHGHYYDIHILSEDTTTFVCFTEEPDGLSIGQSIVIYKHDICVGGGIIDEYVLK